MAPRRRVRWSRVADRDLEQAYAYLLERDPPAARRFAAAIFAAVDRLVAHPELGRVARDLEPVGRYRHILSGRYRVIYRVDDEALVILRVWDTRRDPARLRVDE
jgi:plasmid stabilization system protein ParE